MLTYPAASYAPKITPHKLAGPSSLVPPPLLYAGYTPFTAFRKSKSKRKLEISGPLETCGGCAIWRRGSSGGASPYWRTRDRHRSQGSFWGGTHRNVLKNALWTALQPFSGLKCTGLQDFAYRPTISFFSGLILQDPNTNFCWDRQRSPCSCFTKRPLIQTAAGLRKSR